MIASARGSTCAVSIGTFQGLSPGNGRRPLRLPLGRPVPEPGVDAGAVEPPEHAAAAMTTKMKAAFRITKGRLATRKPLPFLGAPALSLCRSLALSHKEWSFPIRT